MADGEAELLSQLENGMELWREPDEEATSGWRYFAVADGRRREVASIRYDPDEPNKIEFILDV